MRLNLCTLFVVFACASTMHGQQARILTDAEVSAAIERGYQKPHNVGVDVVRTCNECPSTGHEILLYSPAQWIEKEAMRAKRELKPFTLADVTPEMRQPVLHVVVWPDLPNKVYAVGSNVQRVVLTDDSKQMLLQPLSNTTEQVETTSAYRNESWTKAITTFSLDDVSKARGQNGEFFIAVAGSAYTKYFKVTSKLLARALQ